MQRLFVVAFWCALLFAFVMALLPQPPQLPGDPSDKLQHIIAFATLAGLASFAYQRTSWWRIAAGLAVFGALIEVCQMWPPLHRDGSWVDWIADCAAVSAILLLRLAWTAGRPAHREAPRER